MGDTTYPHPYGAYVLLEHLGRGGMAEVDLARRTVDDAQFVRFVVIKRIQARLADDPNFIRMFTDEARISAELQQEHIAQVYDFGQQGDEYFLAMEYVPGVNLRHVQRLLAGRGQVPPFRVTLRIMADVLAALQYAHARVDTYGRPMHLVHRDVNPRNVMLSVRGEVKLIDFGVAKADTRAEHTVGKSMKGKFAYMAPEQIEGGMQVDGRADLFSMGLVLHELVEGRSPYAGLSEAQIMHRTLSGPIPPFRVPALYPDAALLGAIHDRALARSADDRYPDAASFGADVARAADRVGGLASREEMAEFLRKVTPDDVYRITERLKTYRQISTLDRAERPARVEKSAVVEEAATPSLSTPTAPREPAPTGPRPARLDARLIGVGLLSLVLMASVALLAYRGPPAQPLEALAVAPATPAPSPADPVDAAPPRPTAATATAADPDAPASRPRAHAPTQPPSPAPETAPTAAPVEDGFLNVTSRPKLGYRVLVDHVAAGTTPMKAFRLSAGAHEIEVQDPATGQSWRKAVEITATQSTVAVLGGD